MRKPFTKFLSVLTVLAFLVVPVTALAENELPPISLDFGSSPKSFVVVPASGLDTTDLYLNDISYDAKLNGEGDICLYAIDIAVAAKATDILNQYNAGHLVQPYSMLEDIIITGSVGIDLSLKESLKALPDVDEVGKKLVKTAFPIQVRSKNSLILVNALRGMMAEMSVRAENRPLVERLASILENFSANERGFSKSIGDIYAWLYEVRSAIAKGDVDSKFLTQKQTKDVLEIFREIMTEGGMELEDIEFWDDDDAWVGWALKNSEPELSPGMTVKLGDGTGKTLPLTVRTISTPQKESEPESDESEPEPGPGPRPIREDRALTIISENLGAGKDTVELDKADDAYIMFGISEGPEGASYIWQCTELPSYLVFNSDTSSTASITGRPTTVTGPGGINVTVNAKTTVGGHNYIGSLGFMIVVTESSSGLSFLLTGLKFTEKMTPAEEPTAEEPTAEEPTAEEPTAEEPTAEEPTAEEPPAEEPPAEEAPAEEPPAEEAPAEEPPAEEPPAEEPPAEEPPAEEPPAEEQNAES